MQRCSRPHLSRPEPCQRRQLVHPHPRRSGPRSVVPQPPTVAYMFATGKFRQALGR